MSMWLELAPVAHRIAYLNAGGTRTRFLEAGAPEREAVIFLHGSGGYLESYVRNVAAHAEHFHLFAIDMLGHGFTDKPDYDYEPHHYVEHLRAFCNAMGLNRVHLSGDSLGGWVAARFASTYPERVNKLVLILAAGVDYDPTVSARDVLSRVKWRTGVRRAMGRKKGQESVRPNACALHRLFFCQDPNDDTKDAVALDNFEISASPGDSEAKIVQLTYDFEAAIPQGIVRVRGAVKCASTMKFQAIRWTALSSRNVIRMGYS